MRLTIREEDITVVLGEFGLSNADVDVTAAATATAAPEEFQDWALLSNLLKQVAADARIIGICGSQGSGKSTLAATLCRVLGDQAGMVSLDDFYLTRAARADLARRVHPLLATRGVPGTHETDWIANVLSAAERQASVEVPTFDKGLDDRTGTRVIGARPLVFEGWALGAMPQSEAELATPVNDLEAREDPAGEWRRWVNGKITRHYLPLWEKIDFWVHLRVPGFAQVHQWRRQQERQLPADRQMSDATLRRFVQHYERVTRHLWSIPPAAPGVVVQLGSDHRVTRLTAVVAGG